MRLTSLVLFFFVFLNLSGQDHYAELLDQKLLVEFDGRRLRSEYSYSIRINDRRGEEYCDVGIYNSALEKVTGIKAEIVGKNGSIKKLKSRDILERSAISGGAFYLDAKVMEFTLKHNIYPYVLNYSYVRESDQFLSFAYWNPVLDLHIPTRNATLELRIPLREEFNCISNQIGDPKQYSTEFKKIFRWNASFEGEMNNEAFAPHFSEQSPFLHIIPEAFNYAIKGSYNSWTDFGLYISQLRDGLNDLPSPERVKIEKIASKANSDLEKVHLLYHYLQDKTRYVNISLETGGLEPYPASYVAEKSFGDCKALSNYFTAILDAVGIESYYSLVQAGNRIESLDHEVPNQHFNHVIVMVPIEGDTLWLDCTSSNAFNYVGTFIQNRKALVINGDKSYFAAIPKLDLEQVKDEREVHLQWRHDGTCTAHFKNTYRGNSYERLKSLIANAGTHLTEYYLRQVFVEDEFSPDSSVVTDYGRDSTLIGLEIDANSATIFKCFGPDLTAKLILFDLPDLNKPKYRKNAVHIPYPIYKSDELCYEIPVGRKVSGIPEEVVLENSFGSYHLSVSVQGKCVKIDKSFVLYEAEIGLEEYEDLYAFISRIRSIEQNSYIIFE